jgi:hypothetical protein
MPRLTQEELAMNVQYMKQVVNELLSDKHSAHNVYFKESAKPHRSLNPHLNVSTISRGLDADAFKTLLGFGTYVKDMFDNAMKSSKGAPLKYKAAKL